MNVLGSIDYLDGGRQVEDQKEVGEFSIADNEHYDRRDEVNQNVRWAMPSKAFTNKIGPSIATSTAKTSAQRFTINVERLPQRLSLASATVLPAVGSVLCKRSLITPDFLRPA